MDFTAAAVTDGERECKRARERESEKETVKG